MNFKDSVNPLYQYEPVQDQMHSNYAAHKPALLFLNDFFVRDKSKQLLKSLQEEKGKKVSVPDRYSYTELGVSSDLKAIFNDAGFLQFIRNVTGKKCKGVELSVRKFSHGDYTLIHDEEQAPAGVSFFVLLGDAWDPNWGGSTIYNRSDEEPIIFPPAMNGFSVVNTTKDMYGFVKYVNYLSKGKQFFKIEGRII